MNAKEITNFEGGTNTYPGGCNYSGGGSQCLNSNYVIPSQDQNFWTTTNGLLFLLILGQE